MIRGRLWRFLIFFLFLYVIFLLYSLRLFNSDTDITTTTSPSPVVNDKIIDSIDKEDKIPEPIAGPHRRVILSSLEPVMSEGIVGNYEPRNVVKLSGPGENGEGIQLLDEAEKKLGEKSVADYGFNEVASEKISLNRRARDTR
jgi:hypothetical protein